MIQKALNNINFSYYNITKCLSVKKEEHFNKFKKSLFNILINNVSYNVFFFTRILKLLHLVNKYF